MSSRVSRTTSVVRLGSHSSTPLAFKHHQASCFSAHVAFVIVAKLPTKHCVVRGTKLVILGPRSQLFSYSIGVWWVERLPPSRFRDASGRLHRPCSRIWKPLGWRVCFHQLQCVRESIIATPLVIWEVDRSPLKYFSHPGQNARVSSACDIIRMSDMPVNLRHITHYSWNHRTKVGDF
jgi:hypothetical protein